jgi:hypothetical protein
MNSYKSRSYILLRDEPAVPKVDVKHYALLGDAGRQPARRSKTAITVTIVLIGLFAGWIGGKSLTGAFQRSKPATDGSIEENAASQLQPDTRPPANVIAPGVKSARPKDVQPESQQSVELQPSRDRSDEQKEQEDRAVDIPGEQAVKEIGQNAMDNILKADKIKRGKHLKANKNED